MNFKSKEEIDLEKAIKKVDKLISSGLLSESMIEAIQILKEEAAKEKIKKVDSSIVFLKEGQIPVRKCPICNKYYNIKISECNRCNIPVHSC